MTQPEPLQPIQGLSQLPHSGLFVPHRRLTVTGRAEAPTDRGVAFSATLCLDGHPAGRISNRGCGDGTIYTPHTPTDWTAEDMDQFASMCRASNMSALLTETVLDMLYDESATSDEAVEATAGGDILCRKMLPLPDGTHWAAVTTRIPADGATPPDWRRIAAIALTVEQCAVGEFWQAWHAAAQRWLRLV
jgi:hypothetical protein